MLLSASSLLLDRSFLHAIDIASQIPWDCKASFRANASLSHLDGRSSHTQSPFLTVAVTASAGAGNTVVLLQRTQYGGISDLGIIVHVFAGKHLVLVCSMEFTESVRVQVEHTVVECGPAQSNWRFRASARTAVKCVTVPLLISMRFVVMWPDRAVVIAVRLPDQSESNK